MRYRLDLAYNGTNYVGFQSQINGIAIQDILEKALSKLFNEKIKVIMASRTDSGVHAYQQVIHFDADKQFEPYRLKKAVNALIPSDIHIYMVNIVSEDFHARFNVKTKVYEYIINLGEYDPFLINRAYNCFYKIDIDLFIKMSRFYLGRHDFSSFNTTPLEKVKDQNRIIYRFDIKKEKDLLIIEIEGDGFLRHMIRMMIGALVDVSRGILKEEDFIKMLDEPSKTRYKRFNVDASGLYLKRINY